MDSCEEKLTLGNVDEQVEQCLSQPQVLQSPTVPSLARTARNLQSIYEEDRRLEDVWTRINSRAAALNSDKTKQDLYGGGFNPNLHKSGKQSRSPFRQSWRALGIGLVAAMILIIFLTWPMLAYAFHALQTASFHPSKNIVTPGHQPTASIPNMKEYVGQYFTIQYPANWVITSVTTSSTGPYLQTVQFRPSATSSVFVNVDLMPNSDYSANQLLHLDPDTKLGTLQSTSSVSYHGLLWTVGTVELAGSAHAQAGKLKIAYSNQGAPYRIEFGAASGTFSSYTKVFDAMFASFSPQMGPKIGPTVTPAATPIVRPSPTTVPSITNVPGIKVYSGLYFTIQYPADWVITGVTMSGTYQQTVQFRPSATSSVFVNVNVLYSSDLSSNLLLLTDTDVKLGTLLNTSSVSYHGLSWTVGVVNLLGLAQAQSSKAEIAYSNQKTPYKIEFSAPPDMFSSYKQTFDTMFASFSPTS